MTGMLLLLPAAAFCCMFLAWGHWRPVRDDHRLRLLLCTITWLLALWGLTEVLSLGRLLARGWVALGWGLSRWRCSPPGASRAQATRRHRHPAR